MNIDLSRFKVVCGEKVLNAVALLDAEICDIGNESRRIKFITLLVINADGNLRVIRGEAWQFQFIPIITQDTKFEDWED